VTRRLSLVPLAAILAALASLASLAPAAPMASTCAAGSNHAALVVEHGNGSVVTRCVAFAATSISGEELLDRSGLAWSSQTFGGFGDAVCALDGEPAHYVDCPGTDGYWAVFVARANGSWQLANLGISTLALNPGDAEGFRYVPTSGTPAAPVSARGVCVAAATQAPHGPAASGAGAATNPPPSGATPSIAPAGPTAPAADQNAPSPAVAAGAASTATNRPPALPAQNPDRSGGPDIGLLASALAGGALAGLAILRLLAGRRRAS
jgi:uncharacterized membrane protein